MSVAAQRRPQSTASLLQTRQVVDSQAPRAIARHGTYHFLRARGFATSRALSTKSWTTGLSVRFFRVIIPTGTRAYCSLTGKTLIFGLLENLNIEVCIVRKRPVATRL